MRGGSLELEAGMEMQDKHHTPIDIPVDAILQHIVNRYPRLFHGLTPRSSSFVEPGWSTLVDELCFQIDRMLTDEQAE